MKRTSNSSDDLYLLVDGTYASPADVSKGKDGVVRHKNGIAVAMRGTGEPQTAADDAVHNKNVEAARIDPAAEADLTTPPADSVKPNREDEPDGA